MLLDPNLVLLSLAKYLSLKIQPLARSLEMFMILFNLGEFVNLATLINLKNLYFNIHTHLSSQNLHMLVSPKQVCFSAGPFSLNFEAQNQHLEI